MEPLVTIAIPDIAGAAACTITLAALAKHTPEPYEVVLLLEETHRQQVISTPGNSTLRQVSVPAPFGAPAALNLLLEADTAHYILLLESGARVTSGWLERLLAPLGDPSIGLSGPSTNLCWNEQQIAPRPGGFGWSEAQIDAYATELATRYSNQRRPLDTLHSLGDFCYLFKRSVAEQLGGFDEAYGAGPCWEIDFNTRSARAGFKGVWVADAYVHRAPTPQAQVQITRRLFTANKQLYQDRFCGLRLRGKKTSYEAHCRAETCEHFAPADLIQVTLSWNRENMHLASALSEEPAVPKTNDDTMLNTANAMEQIQPPPDASSRVDALISDELPLISCIMPTRNRRTLVGQAVFYFERQDYPNKELIIIDDGEDQVGDLVSDKPDVRYEAVAKNMSIGAKRNLACQLAHGEIIAHWDDDDWYAPHRLSHQVTPLISGQGDMTGLETSCFFDLTRWQAWTCSPELHRKLFIGDVHGGTLVYWRRIWERGVRYPEVSLAEDARFLQLACRRGARLQKLPRAYSFVYLRHDSNAWRFPLGAYLQPTGWQRADLDAFLPPGDLSFYEALLPAAAVPMSGKGDPLVSCIMPTYNRRAFVAQAIAYFLRQDYPNKELIIVDDGTDAIGDLVPVDERFRYMRLNVRTTVGAKRNLACEQARGSIIAHWDDDDWHAQHRLRYQVEALLLEGADMCGINTLLFYDTGSQHAWQYVYRSGGRVWLSGSSLCYRRSFWASNRFANINLGEDARFVWNGRAGRITTLSDTTFHVGIIHPHNVSPKKTNGPYWRPYPVEEIRGFLGADWSFYQPCLVEASAGPPFTNMVH